MTPRDETDDFPCFWVDGKICTRSIIWQEIQDYHPVLPPYRRKEMFNRAACTCCLEGQKVEAMNYRNRFLK